MSAINSANGSLDRAPPVWPQDRLPVVPIDIESRDRMALLIWPLFAASSVAADAARMAYEYADAMLAERAKRGN